MVLFVDFLKKGKKSGKNERKSKQKTVKMHSALLGGNS